MRQERLEFPNLTALMQMAAITWNRDRKLRAIKIVLFIATAIASGIALRIYWPF